VKQLFFCTYSYVVHTEYIYILISWTLRMSDNLPERVHILCHAHIICITVLENRIICCQIFCDLLLKSALEQIFNVMQLILVIIKWHIKWKYLNQKFHDICLSYYFNTAGNRHKQNSWFCKEIREDNFRFWWRIVHEDASQGIYMSKIEIFFFTARILQNQRMLCCGECCHD
jgi:hypothetical protein